ncbi:MAG: DUF1700 domain-containing protein [Clostridia bacterium]|nr:DUF1700 domain-containing protein [Clostridia bacterium]
MSKADFLSALKARLQGLPCEEAEQTLTYYNEMIDDHMEMGMTEEEAVAVLGPIDEIVAQILDDTSLFKLLHTKIKPKRALRTFEIVLIVLGSFIWLPLLIAAAAIFASVYVAIWSVAIALYAVDASLAVGAVCGLFGGVAYLFGGMAATGSLAMGGGLCLAGLAILLAFGCQYAAKGLIRLGKWLLLGTKALLLGKEKVK